MRRILSCALEKVCAAPQAEGAEEYLEKENETEPAEAHQYVPYNVAHTGNEGWRLMRLEDGGGTERVASSTWDDSITQWHW